MLSRSPATGASALQQRSGSAHLFAALVSAASLAGCASAATAPVSAPPEPPATNATATTATPPTIATTTTVDPVRAHIDQLLASLSVEQMAGQLVMGAMPGPTANAETLALLSSGQVGGLFLTDSHGNVVDVAQFGRLTSELQAAAASNRTGIGLLLATDQEGRRVGRYNPPGVTLPEDAQVWAERYSVSGSAQAAVDLTAEQRRVAVDLCAAGLNVNFAPVADVATDGGRVLARRTFGSDPNQVSVLLSAALDGYFGSGVAPTVKHFPGHGATAADSHQSLPIIDLAAGDWEATHKPPFQLAVAADAPLVMVGHLVYTDLDDSGLPASLSSTIITDLLRVRMGYDGVVITDDLSVMQAVATFPLDERVVLAVNAGVDIVLLADAADAAAASSALATAAHDGTIEPDRLQAAARRVLQLKADLGQLGDDLASVRCGADPID